ncbi:MAG: hypothetical protein R2725_16535 [Solirubrobacterales bacterium]
MVSVAIAVAALCLPAGAAAQRYVPPGNSAATQYTEVIPSSGGQQDAEHHRKKKVVPVEVLGERTVSELEAEGPVGREVAEIAAATAPVPVDREPTRKAKDDGKEGQGASGVAGGGGGEGGPPAIEPPAGSSGAGEVLGQATGLSSGQLGLLLPLLIVGAIVWAAVFLQRRGHRIA